MRNLHRHIINAGIALGATLALAGPAATQEFRGPRTWFTGWAGSFSDREGFSDGEVNAFYRFDRAFAFGGGIHRVMRGADIGIDALYARPSYERFDADTGASEGKGEARAASGLLSARIGGGGVLGIYFGAGAGVFAWDLTDPELEDGWDIDPALSVSVGLELAAAQRARVFAEYGQWWIYHQKDGVAENTVSPNLLRVGGRLGL
jgi:hypothetical protein